MVYAGLIKAKALPDSLLKILIDCYNWGYDEAKANLTKKTPEEITESLNRGFRKGIKQRGVKSV